MTRIKRGIMTKRRHKRLLKETRGFWGQRKNVFRRASETLLRAMAFAFEGRKLKKRDMRGLFIIRIKAAAEQIGTKYNIVIHKLKQSNVLINRKILSQIAVYDPQVFNRIVDFVQAR